MVMSDEQPDDDEDLSQEVVDMFNKKILGYKQDYIEETEDMTHEKKGKEKPGNAQNLETPKIDMPLDFMKIKFSELIHDDKEHFFMDQTKLAEVECPTCKLIFDYTQICPHQDIKSKEHKDSW